MVRGATGAASKVDGADLAKVLPTNGTSFDFARTRSVFDMNHMNTIYNAIYDIHSMLHRCSFDLGSNQSHL